MAVAHLKNFLRSVFRIVIQNVNMAISRNYETGEKDTPQYALSAIS